MKVKVGNKIHDGKKEPVMVILTNKDKFNIARMALAATKYCEYPEDKFTREEIEEWMKEEERKKVCPECGGNNYTSTLMVFLGRDNNDIVCKCGWKGKAYQLKEVE